MRIRSFLVFCLAANAVVSDRRNKIALPNLIKTKSNETENESIKIVKSKIKRIFQK